MFRKKIKWKKAAPYLIGAGVVLLLMTAFRSKPTEVEVSTASFAPMSVAIKEEGIAAVRSRYVITTPVNGHLNRIALSEGMAISKDQTVLATLEPGLSGFLDPRAREEARARLKAARALRKLKEAEAERVKASLDLAEKEYNRAEQLDKKNYISQKEWDETEANVRILNQELSGAQFALSIADYEVEQLEAKLKEAGDVQNEQLESLKLVSPIDGHVLKVYDSNARYISLGTPLMEIGNLDDLVVEIEMLSSDAVAIKKGASVQITQWGSDFPLRGKISSVDPGAYTKTSSLGVEEQRVKVHADLISQPPKNLRLGDKYRVEAEVVVWESDRALQIPAGALFRRGSQWMVFIADEGKVLLREVKTGHHNGRQAEVLEGLEEGDIVVVYPPESITAGTKIFF